MITQLAINKATDLVKLIFVFGDREVTVLLTQQELEGLIDIISEFMKTGKDIYIYIPDFIILILIKI